MDLGTPEQMRKTGRTLLGTKRGESKRAYVLSVLDVLLEEGDISPAQKSFGDAWWRMRELALPMLSVAENPLYGGVWIEPSPEAEEVESSQQAEDGALTEIWIILNSMIARRYAEVLNACCRPEEECSATMIKQVFGVNTITTAFEELERLHPIAAREFEGRIR